MNNVPQNIIKALEKFAKNKSISCAEAYQIAEELQVSVREIGEAAEALDLKIKHCQLGCF